MRLRNRLRNIACKALPIIQLAAVIATGVIPGIRALSAQVRPTEGLHVNTPKVFALTGATIHTEPGKVISSGTIVIRDGLIESVGRSVRVPKDAVTIDLKGKTVYAGFIESVWETKAKEGDGGGGRGGRNGGGTADKKSVDEHWNARVTPAKSVLDGLELKDKDIEALNALGFTVAHVMPHAGVFRGNSALIHLAHWGPEAPIRSRVTQTMAFESSRWPDRHYPSSLLGAIALMRQTLLDASWYEKAWNIYGKNQRTNEQPEYNRDLESLAADISAQRPFLFSASDELAILRAGNIAKEFKLRLWINGNGYEYRQLAAIKALGAFLIIPVNFPEAPKVATLEEELQVSYGQLRHWDQAPDNAQRLADASVRFALTSSQLKDRKEFRANLARAVQRGLDKTKALAALTTTPASRFGLGQSHGKIAKGYVANLVVTDGDYFDKKTKVQAVWVAGKKVDVAPDPMEDFRGEWSVSLSADIGGKRELVLKIKGEAAKPEGEVVLGDDKTIALENLSAARDAITWTLPADSLGGSGKWRFSGTQLSDAASGTGLASNGNRFSWTATRTAPFSEDKKDKQDDKKKEKPPEKASNLRPLYPEGAYGRTGPPKQPAAILVKNATVWTMGKQGIIMGGDVLMVGGKISAVGKNLSIPRKSRGNAVEIDGTGKHVTPGLIDAHSHTAMASVNEGAEAVTSEVRIKDVTNSDDINIYRQLAGGLTMANGLHGSANPIGGQNAVIKLRWGLLPDKLIEPRAPQGIKFALGENVKQSNWGDDFVTRYPQTRMGVEQIIRDAFQAAKEYDADWKAYNKSSKRKKSEVPPRRDLELEALVEILNGERIVHAHSYRQDEILSLIRIADDFNFTIATFTHVLEGYKVAAEIAKHGAGGSTFSDWWGYKFEVIDAIPFNGAIMARAGVVTSFNSDDSDLARRLNTEGAKAVRYGGLTNIEALAFVTINPAIQLKVDKFAGSLEKGKDADFVIWSGDPLSTYTRAEQTWIEGRKYFDLDDDRKMRAEIKSGRARLIQKILASSEAPESSGAKKGKHK